MARKLLLPLMAVIIIVAMVVPGCGGEPTPPPPPPPRDTGPWLDEVVINLETSGAAAIAQLQADDLDVYAYGMADAALYAEVLADPGLTHKESVGSFNEFSMNPAGPIFGGTGKLNPFDSAVIREALNWLVDRDWVVGNIMGGLGVPRYTALNGAFEAAIRYADALTAVEAKYENTPANLAAAFTQVHDEMLALNATYDGTPGVVGGDFYWDDGGGSEQVELIFLIRTEDERMEMGDYMAGLLEDWGFAVTKQYGESGELSAIWYATNPDDGLWHLYTGGWVSTVISRDDGYTFALFHTDLPGWGPLWMAYGHDMSYFTAAEKLWNNDFASMAERETYFGTATEDNTTCLWGAMEDGYRIFVVTRKSFTPMQVDVDMASDLAGAVYGSWMWALTAHFLEGDPAEPVLGGTLRVSMPGILTEPWNPIAGTNWVYDMFPIRATGDMGHHPDTRTGLRWAGRIESAEVFNETGLPVEVVNTDWCSLTFQAEIVVPQDAWADWDATTQEFLTVEDRFGAGPTTCLRKSVSYYPLDIFEFPLHDGSTLSMGDFIMFFILQFDQAKVASAIYDVSAVPDYDAWMSMFKGVKYITDDPMYGLIVEYYSDNWEMDAERAVTTMFPVYDQGPGLWHTLALGIAAEAANELAFSSFKADDLDVEWTSFIAGPSLPILKGHLDDARAAVYPANIPYAATLGDYVDAAEATERYDNLNAFYMDPEKTHFWVCMGPFYLQRAFPAEKVVHLVRFEDYPDDTDRWMFLLDPL